MMRLILICAALTACASTPDANYVQTLEQYQVNAMAQQEATKALATSCESDLCRYLVAQEMTRSVGSVPTYTAPPSIVLGVIDRITGIVGIAAPIYGAKELARQHRLTVGSVANAVASIPSADNSTTTTVTVGGNYGDTDQSTTYGDGTTIGNENGDGSRAGGDVTIGDQNDNSGRIASPGPIDNSNPGDEGNVINPQPVPPEDPPARH